MKLMPDKWIIESLGTVLSGRRSLLDKAQESQPQILVLQNCLLASEFESLPDSLPWKPNHLFVSNGYAGRTNHGCAVKRSSLSIEELESKPLPHMDESFDGIIVSGIIEYFQSNLAHFLFQCHRVLNEGGILFLTAPNVHNIESFMSLLKGKNIYTPFTRFCCKVTREFTGTELRGQIEASGFNILKEIQAEDAAITQDYQNLLDLLQFFSRKSRLCHSRKLGFACVKGGKRSYIFSPLLHKWTFLDRSLYRNFIVMGENDTLQLGGGWHALEEGPPPNRWSGRRGEFFLKREEDERILEILCHLPEIGNEISLPSIEVEGERQGAQCRKTSAWQSLRVTLAAGLPNNMHLALIPERIYQPSLFGLQDDRELGVCVSQIALRKGYCIFLGKDDDIFLGDGWHNKESTRFNDSHRHFRWTAGRASLLLFPRGGEKVLKLTCYIPGEPEISAFLAIESLAQECALPVTGCWQDVEITLTKGVRHPFEIEFCVSETWVPAELLKGSEDRRALGIAISSVRLAYDGEHNES